MRSARSRRANRAISRSGTSRRRPSWSIESGSIRPINASGGGNERDDPAGRDEGRRLADDLEIGRAHVCNPVTNAHRGCRLLPEHTKKHKPQLSNSTTTDDTSDLTEHTIH